MTRWISFIRRRTWPPPVNELYREQEKMKQNEVMKMLYDVQHPAKGDRNIVELGMVDKVEIEGNKVTVTIAFPKHRDPLAEYLIGSTKAALIRHIPGVEAEVRTIVREESARKPAGLDLGLEELAGVKHIIAVASGKGGVISGRCDDRRGEGGDSQDDLPAQAGGELYKGGAGRVPGFPSASSPVCSVIGAGFRPRGGGPGDSGCT